MPPPPEVHRKRQRHPRLHAIASPASAPDQPRRADQSAIGVRAVSETAPTEERCVCAGARDLRRRRGGDTGRVPGKMRRLGEPRVGVSD